MKCPKCGVDDDKVLDSRSARDGAAIRRRRECAACGHRFTTYEEIDRDEVLVVKRDGTRQTFERAKLDRAIRQACGKRKISDEQIRSLIDRVVSKLDGSEVPSATIASRASSTLAQRSASPERKAMPYCSAPRFSSMITRPAFFAT